MANHDKTQKDLIDDLKVNRSAISSWCNAQRTPRIDKLELLGDYFGVPIEYFLRENISHNTMFEQLQQQTNNDLKMGHLVYRFVLKASRCVDDNSIDDQSIAKLLLKNNFEYAFYDFKKHDSFESIYADYIEQALLIHEAYLLIEQSNVLKEMLNCIK
jgi:repressor LexA